MSPTHAKWANDRPADSVQYDLGTHDAVQECSADPITLGLGGEAILAKAIADKPAEKRFAATMPDGICLTRQSGIICSIRGPDDVQAGAKLDVPHLLPTRLFPYDKSSNPKPRSFEPFSGAYRQKLRVEKVRLLRH